MTEKTKNTEKPNEQAPTKDAPADVQKSLDDAHQKASAHFNATARLSGNNSYDALRNNAEQAAAIIKDLHNTIKKSTPTGSTAEVMHSDNNKAQEALKNIDTKDPLAPYEGYSAYAVPQSPEKDPDRNYHENPLTYDVYTVSEDKKNLNVQYSLTEMHPGGVSKAMNNPNAISGSSDDEQSFSYNEQKSGKKTIITTEHTTKGRRSPTSEHFHNNETLMSEFQNKTTNHLVYDKDKRLIEAKTCSESNRIISEGSYSGKDLSTGNYRTGAEITAVLGDYTRFAQAQWDKNGEIERELKGEKSKYTERYTYCKGNNYTEVSHRKNEKGEWVYEGCVGRIKGDELTSLQKFSPKLAEKRFKKFQEEAYNNIKDLTGAKSLDDYASRLGSPPPELSLDAIWNNQSNSTDADKAKEANEKFVKPYEDKPLALVAIKDNQRD